MLSGSRNSKTVSLYKDGILDSRITLPTNITNTGQYLTNEATSTDLDFNIPDIIGKKLFIKTYASGNNSTSKYFLIWRMNTDSTKNKYVKSYFDAASSMGFYAFLGMDFYGLDNTYSQRISIKGTPKEMRVYEIWYE